MHSLKAIVVLCVYVAVCLMRQQTSGDNKSAKINTSAYKAPPCGIVARTDGDISYFNKTVAGVGQFPWQAAVFYKDTNTFVCSGVLVSAQLILTSILCLEDRDVADFDVRLGDWDLMTRASTEEFPHLTLGVKQAYTFPEGTPIVAALKLEKPVDFLVHAHILPICLPTLNEDKLKLLPKQGIANHQCLVSGWGLKLRAGGSDMDQSGIHQMSKSMDEKKYDQIMSEMNAAVKLNNDKTSWKPIGFDVPVLTSDLEMHRYHHYDGDIENVAHNAGDNSDDSSKSLNKIDEAPTLVRKTKNPNPLDEFYEYADAEVFPRRKGSHDDKMGESSFDNLKSVEKARRDTGYAITTTSDGGTVIMEDTSQIGSTEARMREFRKYYSGEEPDYGRAKKDSVSPALTSSEALLLSETPEARLTRADVPEDITLLKTLEVKIQDSCRVTPQLAGVPAGKSCAVPTNPVGTTDMCLVDWGTPVTCFENVKPKRPSHPKYKWTRAYLAGLVSWKQQCIGIEDVDGDATTNTALIMNTYEMFDFIKKHME